MQHQGQQAEAGEPLDQYANHGICGQAGNAERASIAAGLRISTCDTKQISMTHPTKPVDHTEIVAKIRRLLAHGMTRVDIGVRLGLKDSTIRRWLKECP